MEGDTVKGEERGLTDVLMRQRWRVKLGMVKNTGDTG